MTTTRTPIGWRAGHGQNIVESTSCKTESGPQNLPEMPAYRRLHPHRLDGSQSLTPADRTTGRSPARSTSEQTRGVHERNCEIASKRASHTVSHFYSCQEGPREIVEKIVQP